MIPTPAERQSILDEWQNFSRTKVFAFRGITSAAYALYAPSYFSAIAERSHVEIIRGANDELLSAIVYEPIDDATIVHWAWTDFRYRNQGNQYLLWERCGLTGESNIFISHLTVLSEKLAEKYGWLYSPFSLYKGNTNESNEDAIQSWTSKSAQRADANE